MKLKILLVFCIVITVAQSIPHKQFPRTQKLKAKALVKALVGEGNYRLPKTSYPLSYDVKLVTHLEDTGNTRFNFDGSVEIRIRVINDTQNIVLHKRGITIEKPEVRFADNATTILSYYDDLENDYDFLTISNTFGNFMADNEYVITIKFTGPLRDDNLGFYKSSYVNKDNETIWIATTQFESVEARTTFPCYDEPGFRAKFKITITHGKQFHAISNMNVETRNVNANNIVTQFYPTPEVQTYLIAFIISDFKSVSTNDYAKIPQRVFAKPQSVDAGEADVALRYGQVILDKFVEYLNVDYKLPKMDQIALTDFDAGAMENWGLVTYREEYLLYNRLTSRSQQKENVMTVISHEFAHQYFGNLVSPQWWDYLWLNEGFATLYEWYLVSLIYKDDRLMDSFIMNAMHPALEYDGNDVRAMTAYVETPAEIDDLFDYIAYEKSGSVLRMFQHVLGEKTWERGLNYYLTEMALKSATSADLYRGLQKAIDEEGRGNIDVAKAFGSWETQSGYPVVNVMWNNDELILTQERFLYEEEDNSTLWHIPINYVLGTNPDFGSTKADLWMAQTKNLTITKSNAPKQWKKVDWLIINSQQGYYYRVNYDENLWRLLTEQLIRDHTIIHHLNRAQLIDDSFQLARAKKVDYGVALSIMKYLKTEVDYVPWESAYNGIMQLKQRLEGTKTFAKYQKFIQNLVIEIFNKFGMEVIDYEHKFDRYLRSSAIHLACQFGIESCLDGVKNKLTSVLSRDEISPDLQAAVYQNALRTANEGDYRKMIQKMLSTEDQGQRTVMIAALGCTNNKNLQIELLNLALRDDQGVRRQEKLRIFNAWTNGGSAGIRGVMEFVKNNYVQIENIQKGRAGSMISSIASRINTQELKTEFTQFLSGLKTDGRLNAEDETSLSNRAGEIISWQQENAKNIEDWLDRNGSTKLFFSPVIILFLIFVKFFL